MPLQEGKKMKKKKTEQTQNDDPAGGEEAHRTAWAHLPGRSSSIPSNIACKDTIVRHTENGLTSNLRDQAKTERIKSDETTTRYRPAPPNLMHQNCRIPYTNAHQRNTNRHIYQHIQTTIWTKTVRENRRRKQISKVPGRNNIAVP